MKIQTVILMLLVSLTANSALAASVKLDAGQRTVSDLKRDKTSKPLEILAFSQISDGMKVADIFGGGGYYAELLSQLVGPKGKVYLHNNNAYLKFVGDELKARVANNRLANVVDHQHEADDMAFAANSLDAIFFVLGYHDMYHKSNDWDIPKDKFLQQLTSALKKDGLLLIVDHAAVDDSGVKYAQGLHRIDEKYVKQELTSLGYTLIDESQVLRNSQDNRLISPFNPKIRRQTDRFVLLFKKK